MKFKVSFDINHATSYPTELPPPGPFVLCFLGCKYAGEISEKKKRTSLTEPSEPQIHIPATVLLDVQAIYPQHLVPNVLRDMSEWYIAFSGDPLIRGAFYGGPEYNWFRAFLYLEAYVRGSIREEETDNHMF